jgi:hypothetical protein
MRDHEELDGWEKMKLGQLRMVQMGEYELAGKNYNPSISVYDQLFRCPAHGCAFRNLYWKEYCKHVREGTHYRANFYMAR